MKGQYVDGVETRAQIPVCRIADVRRIAKGVVVFTVATENVARPIAAASADA
jgi:hypothetical protein